MLPGLTFTIEPILKVGSTEFFEWKDKWTIEAVDHFISAQFEHTILILENGVEILTAGENEDPFVFPTKITNKLNKF